MKEKNLLGGKTFQARGQSPGATDTRERHGGSMFWNPCHQREQALRFKKQAQPDGRMGVFEWF